MVSSVRVLSSAASSTHAILITCTQILGKIARAYQHLQTLSSSGDLSQLEHLSIYPFRLLIFLQYLCVRLWAFTDGRLARFQSWVFCAIFSAVLVDHQFVAYRSPESDGVLNFRLLETCNRVTEVQTIFHYWVRTVVLIGRNNLFCFD
jgi:hypothetical protein